ncbi:MAG: CHASE2 domain-containing protein [Betaproteobacteria bacterium]|nr:CHASE2 domain-containing protein [Betaproteobacteria bacterium]
MKKAGFWTKDWFFGLVITLVVLGLAMGKGVFDGLETKAYDWGVTATSKPPNDKVAVIAIDDNSIANIGRWPWPRDVHAAMIDKLAGAKAAVIGSSIFYFEPQIDPGLQYINKMIEVYGKHAPSETVQVVDVASLKPGATPAPPKPAAVPSGALAEMGAVLAEAEQALNTDRRLAESIQKANNVVLPMFIPATLEAPISRAEKPFPEFVIKNSIANVSPGEGSLVFGEANGAAAPIEEIGKVAAGIGNLSSIPDADGGSRHEVIAIDFEGKQYPSFALMVAARSLNMGAKDIRVNMGESISVGNLRIATNTQGMMLPYFYKRTGDRPAIPEDSFFDVITGKIPADKYKGKVVLIGPTAAGVGSLQVTPIDNLAPVQTMAHTVSSILQQHFFRTPSWTVWVSLLVTLLIAAYLIAVLPRLRAGPAALLSLGILVILFGTHFGLMMGPGIWMKLMLPASLLVIGHLLLTTKRFLVTERGKEQADAAGAESNRMLGLAFQQQGQLDMAFDKFRKCPVDEQVLENIYSLALDFERRRQFNKAESAFGYINQHDPKFKDVAERMNRAKAMSETIILGGSSAARSSAATMVLSGTGEKPKLGRYTVEKELGKGAMGVVYLGKDPKIGREVAIKTMALAAEFEGDELQEAKDRFFREAESAGKLDHPNIVKIYDAGEEHDLAFIAMEFLKGKDLVDKTKQPNLMPFDELCDVMIKVAQALHHAHEQGVYHRDIKPANIMYDAENKVPKVADFGIARVTDSSKTKTGMVLGTPSYMSPEQLAGKKIDGRSDLFSLGVTFYQMACGRLPFEGESMTQLMFAIANETPPNIMEYNPSLPSWVPEFIEQALAKDLTQRFADGNEFAMAIKTYRSMPS